MESFISEYWRLNRSAVSPDTDELIRGISEQIPAGRVLEARSGTSVLDWQVPPRWEVRKGQLRRVSGEILANFAENPLVLWTHSIGFKGRVPREELLRHVVSDANRPDEVFYRYQAGYRYRAEGSDEWGFSLPHRLVAGLSDPEYDVEIDADLDNEGSIKVFNAFLPGRLPDTVFFMAHTCHPAQVADGLANVAVLMELYRHLESLSDRQCSYRFLFGPEYFGAAAYLAKAPREEVERLSCGLYCDMLSSGEPIAWQPSFRGESRIDAVLQSVIPHHASFWTRRPYRKMWGNDEMFFNGPGFEIPMAAIGRGHSEAAPREYHFDSDNLDAVDGYHLVESLWILQRIVEVFETDRVPVPKFQGPPCQSKHGIYADATARAAEYELREAVPIMIDGKRSIMEVTRELGADFFAVREFVGQMEARGLVESGPLPASEG
jgi:aminopeptidase-like protein